MNSSDHLKLDYVEFVLGSNHKQIVGTEQWLRMNYSKRRNYASYAVSCAVREGIIERGQCGLCVAPNYATEAHHPDYDNPYKIAWLCPKHHRRLHLSDPIFVRRVKKSRSEKKIRRRISFRIRGRMFQFRVDEITRLALDMYCRDSGLSITKVCLEAMRRFVPQDIRSAIESNA